jgi:hypothetical protein
MKSEDEQFFNELSEALNRRSSCQLLIVGKMLNVLLEHYTLAEISEACACVLECSAHATSSEAEEAWQSVITYLRDGKPLIKEAEADVPLRTIQYHRGRE